MTAHAGSGPTPTLLGLSTRPIPARVARQVHRIPPGGRLECTGQPWADALALLEVGCVELQAASGAGLHLCPGAIFSLRGLTPAVLSPTASGSAVVVTLRRRTEGDAS